MILLCAAIVAVVFLGLRAGFQSMRPHSDPVVARPVDDDSLVALDDGSVLIAKPGTVSRTVIDWFNNPNAASKTFDIGWQAFEPGSAQPVPESEVRLDRFAVEMHANPDVEAKIIVCTAATDRDALRLASLRAARLEQLLVARQVEPRRLSAATCRLRDADKAAASQSAQDGEVIGVALSR